MPEPKINHDSLAVTQERINFLKSRSHVTSDGKAVVLSEHASPAESQIVASQLLKTTHVKFSHLVVGYPVYVRGSK